MPPRTNPIRDNAEFKKFLAMLYSDLHKGFDDATKAAQQVPSTQAVVARARKQFGDDDAYLITDAVLRAQAHQMAALFIRRARKAAGLTSQQLAERMGISLTQLSDAQSFRSLRKVPLDFLVRVAYHCGGDLSLLLDRSKHESDHRRMALPRAKAKLPPAKHK